MYTGTFDVRDVSLNVPVVKGRVCLNVIYVKGSETHGCFILFDTGREFVINKTYGCIPNVSPGTYNIIATDADAEKQIDIAAAVTIQIVVPNYTMAQSVVISPSTSGESF